MPMARDNASYVCVFDTPPDRQEFGELLAELLRIPRPDAMRLAAAAPGLLPLPMVATVAGKLAERIRAAGFAVEVLNSEAIPRLGNAENVHHVRCLDQGLEIVEIHATTERLVPWDAVEMIAVGQLPDGAVRHYIEDETLLTAARRVPHESQVVQITPGPELWLVTRCPTECLRVHHELMNYEYLGSRRSTTSTVNFRQFVEDLVRFAPRAFLPTSTQAYLSRGPLLLYGFESAEGFEHWNLLQLLLHRETMKHEG